MNASPRPLVSFLLITGGCANSETKQSTVSNLDAIPNAAVCNGTQLAAPPGGFICTGITIPADAALATVATAQTDTMWPMPVLQDGGQWVVLAPFFVNSGGHYEGDAVFRLHRADGTELTAIEGSLLLPSIEVAEPTAALQTWADAQASAWSATGDIQNRELGIRLKLISEVFVEATQRRVEATLIDGQAAPIQFAESQALSQATEQALAGLSAAGMGDDWATVPRELTRTTHSLLPKFTNQANSTPTRVELITLAGAVALGILIGFVVQTSHVNNALTWVHKDANRQIDNTIARIVGNCTNESADTVCNGAAPEGPPPPPGAVQCVDWNTEEPLAQELSALIPSPDEGDSEAPFPPSPEGYLLGECSDGVDNDGNGTTDCDDPACASASDCGGALGEQDLRDGFGIRFSNGDCHYELLSLDWRAYESCPTCALEPNANWWSYYIEGEPTYFTQSAACNSTQEEVPADDVYSLSGITIGRFMGFVVSQDIETEDVISIQTGYLLEAPDDIGTIVYFEPSEVTENAYLSLIDGRYIASFDYGVWEMIVWGQVDLANAHGVSP